MATRFYLGSVEASAVNPSFSGSGWTEQDAADRRRMTTGRNNSAMTSKTDTQTATAAGSSTLLRQYVSDILAPQVVAAGTWKGTVRALESAANDNVDAVRSRLFAVSADGATDLGDLSAIGNMGPVAEFATTLRAKRIADGDATSAITITQNWRLVCELGFTNTAIGTSVSATLSFGDDSATDLGDNETDTTALNPFIELSVDLVYAAAGNHPLKSLAKSLGATFGVFFDVASGSLTDFIGGKPGPVSGTPTYGAAATMPNGRTAIDFPAVGDFFTFADHADLDVGVGPVTLMCGAARDEDLATWQVAFHKGTTAYEININNLDFAEISKVGTAGLVRSSTTVPADGSFHTYAGSLTGGTGAGRSKMYVDAADVTVETDTTSQIADTTTGLEVGREGAAFRLGGKLAFILIFKAVLTQAQIQSLHDAALRGPFPRSPYHQLLAH